MSSKKSIKSDVKSVDAVPGTSPVIDMSDETPERKRLREISSEVFKKSDVITEVNSVEQKPTSDCSVVLNEELTNNYDFKDIKSMEMLINGCENNIKQSFVHIAFALYKISTNNLFDSNVFSDIYDYCFAKFGYSKTTTKSMLGIARCFIDDESGALKKAYEKYPYSLLVEMSSMFYQSHLILPTFTVKQAREIKKFVYAHYDSSMTAENIFDVMSKSVAAANNAIVEHASQCNKETEQNRIIGEISFDEIVKISEKGAIDCVELCSRDLFNSMYNDRKKNLTYKLNVYCDISNDKRFDFELRISFYDGRIVFILSYFRQYIFDLRFNYLFDEPKTEVYEKYRFFYDSMIKIAVDYVLSKENN